MNLHLLSDDELLELIPTLSEMEIAVIRDASYEEEIQ